MENLNEVIRNSTYKTEQLRRLKELIDYDLYYHDIPREEIDRLYVTYVATKLIFPSDDFVFLSDFEDWITRMRIVTELNSNLRMKAKDEI